MNLARGPVTWTIKQLSRILCRLDDAELAKVPDRGPLIVICNHINFLDVPVLFTHLQPRPVTGLAKTEAWDNPGLNLLFNLWGGVPIRRGEADLTALRRGLELLEAGYIVGVAPEGTRSHHGRLQQGHPGVVWLALRSAAPVLPIVYYGTEQFHHNLARLRRTDFCIRVGRQFRLDSGGVRVRRAARQEMLDEIMYQMATLLPPAYRGLYADLSMATTEHLRFLPDAAEEVRMLSS
jgi:1-acyl-sn-glycerol-3-phosphate acyltransferase